MKTMEKRTKTRKSHADENILGIYFTEISRVPLLTKEEEIEAAKAATQGDMTARNKLINSNLRFVISIAKKYQGLGVSLGDLINEGNIGLINAVEKFDAERGYRFISYAVWWIRQSILKALNDTSRLIRLPVNQSTDLIHIKQAQKMLGGDYDPENQVEEIAQMLNIKKHYVEDIMAISREVVSLEKLVDGDSGALLLENVVVDDRYDAPEQATLQKFLEEDVEELLTTLNDKEAEIIRMHFGLGERIPMSLREIGERFNLTKERIRQIEEKALSRLRHISRRSKLEPYVA